MSAKFAERLAFAFVLVAASLTYLYGTYEVLPEVLAESSYVVQILCRALTTWIFIAILANMYLVRKRDSSIRSRLLLQPVFQPVTSNMSGMDTECQLRETAKHMGECFLPKPFGEGSNWHICASCEVFVPPRCWHCHACNTCILRRDHHCVFTGCCIGEENQSNFLSLLFYLGCGTSISAVLSFIYCVYYKEMSLWWYMFRLVGMIYTVFLDFQMTLILASINSIGQMAAWGVFGFYLYIASKGQTSADSHRKVEWTLPGQRRFSLKNMSEFLGPNPILRILWPFHPPLRIDYNAQVVTEEDHRKGL